MQSVVLNHSSGQHADGTLGRCSRRDVWLLSKSFDGERVPNFRILRKLHRQRAGLLLRRGDGAIGPQSAANALEEVCAPNFKWASNRLSARHLDALSIHPSIVLGEQRGNHQTDIVGQAGTAECGRFRDMPIHLRIVAHDTA
jgi:hypothetical protein